MRNWKVFLAALVRAVLVASGLASSRNAMLLQAVESDYTTVGDDGDAPASGLCVVINEVAWGGTAASSFDEWIELCNNTGEDIDLTGWTLRSADGTPDIALDGVIPAHGYFLLERTNDDTVSDIAADQIYTGAVQNNPAAETLELRDADENLIDTANGDGGQWPAGTASPDYYSMERVDPTAADTDANWASNNGVTRNGHDADGEPINGTPKQPNSTASAAEPDHLVVSPAEATVVADQTIAYTAELFDSHGNLVADVTADTTFSIEKLAFGSWDGNVYTAAKAGTWTVTGDYRGAYGDFCDTASLTVTAGELARFFVKPPPTGIAGRPFSTKIYAKDRHGTIIRDFNGVVALSTDRGRIVPSEVVLRNGTNSSAPMTLFVAGDRLVEVTYGDITSSAIIHIYPAAPVELTVRPQTETVTAGERVAYAATAQDAYGNTWNATADTDFAIEAAAGGSWEDNVYTSARAGTWTVTGEYEGVVDTASLTVRHAPARSIEITPDPETVIAGESVTYWATAQDAYGNTWDATADTDFDTEAGGFWTDNVYTSARAGTWTVTGEYAGVVDTASLTVEHAGPGSIEVSPASATVVTGKSVTYTVAAADVFGNTWDVTEAATFSTDGTAGGSWQDNVYTSKNLGLWMVTATYLETFTDTAVLEVTVMRPVSIVLSVESANAVAGDSLSFTVTAYDAHGNEWDVSAEAEYRIEAAAGGMWEGNTCSAAKAGRWIVTASYDGCEAQLLITVEPNVPAHLALSAEPTTIPADGQSTAVIAARVADDWDNPVADGTPVTFSTTVGTLAAETVLTDGGLATVVLASELGGGVAVITVTAGEVQAMTEVGFATPTSGSHTIYLPVLFMYYLP